MRKFEQGLHINVSARDSGIEGFLRNVLICERYILKYLWVEYVWNFCYKEA